MPSDSGGTRSRSGGMSVSLASPDGRVVGGGVAGLLVAASPVQVWLLFCQSCLHPCFSSLSIPLLFYPRLGFCNFLLTKWLPPQTLVKTELPNFFLSVGFEPGCSGQFSGREPA